jgi:hypothetical protein
MKVGQIVALKDDLHFNANAIEDPYGPDEPVIIFAGAMGRVVYVDSNGRGVDVNFFAAETEIHWVEVELLKEVDP